MHAVVEIGGRQYRVKEGDIFSVERLEGETGSSLTFDSVLAVGDGSEIRIGAPKVDGASVQATILTQDRAKKILVFKFKRRKNYKRLKGHRQYFTRLRVTGISA